LANLRQRLPGLLRDSAPYRNQPEDPNDDPEETITSVHERDWPFGDTRSEVTRTKEGTQLLLTRMVAQKRARVSASRVMIAYQ
jgi:hypothetical protein